jgi:two-component system KDP operon response regulator KdpE
MNETRILIIDDEYSIRNILKINLATKNYTIDEAVDGKTGLIKAKDFHPHLIILDLSLPDTNGLEILKELRSWTKIPIIILTVHDDETTKVRLLDAGADDYLCKPFGINELLARVRVGLRNHGHIEATPIYHSDDLSIDLNQKKTFVSAKEVKLTQTEFEVLSRLVREQGKVVSQTTLLKQIWGITATDQNHYLRIYINQLRKKIEKNPSDPKHIITEPGVGYRFI